MDLWSPLRQLCDSLAKNREEFHFSCSKRGNKGGLHPPWAQAAQEASLSPLRPSRKLLLIGKCHKFHSQLWELSPLGRAEGLASFFLFFFFELGVWCWESTFKGLFQSLWLVQHHTKQPINTASLHHTAKFDTMSANILFFVIYWANTTKNPQFRKLFCCPNLNKSNCGGSKVKHGLCPASATGDSLWINEMSAKVSHLYPLNLSKRK